MDCKGSSMERSITILKDFVYKYFHRDLEKDYTLTIELDEFINGYEINIEDKKKEEAIRFFIDREKEEVESFRYMNYEGRNRKLPYMSMDEAKVTADKFLEKLLGAGFKNLKLNEDMILVGSSLNQYAFWYKEYVNDIEINKSYVMVYVDGGINKVVYFDNHLEKHVRIEDQKNLISEKDALDCSLNHQYAKGEEVVLDVRGRKYERELNILIYRNIINKDFNLDATTKIGDVIRLITKVLESRVEFLEDEDDEEILFIDIDRENPYYEYIKKAVEENLIQNEEKTLDVFREATIAHIKELLLYAIDPYGDEEDYKECKYKKAILDVLSMYGNKKIRNEELAYIFYRIFSK